MRLRLTMLPRLVAKIVGQRRTLQALTACAIATLWASTASAQLTDGLVYPGDSAVGTAALGENMSYSDVAQSQPPNGIFVGPGGETSVTNVPSALDSGRPSRNKYVSNQTWPQGGMVQPAVPYPDTGIPCPCDLGCDFTYYGSVEALYFRRGYDERFTLSQFKMEPFDFEWGSRITVGKIWDCVNGYEFVYAGPFKWSREMGPITGAGILSRMSPAGTYGPGDISAFINANYHYQAHEARLNTFEVNRRWWAWDVFSVLIGMRAVDYREYYTFVSNSPAGFGVYQDYTRNRMFGPQVGGEINQALGLRGLVGFKGKLALLGNFFRNTAILDNAGLNRLDTVNSDVDFAGMFDFGSYLKYSLTPSIRLSTGYDMWFVPGVATVSRQGLNVVSETTAAKANNESDLFVHGVSFGAQILY